MTSRLAAMQARPIFVLIVNYRTGRLAVDSISSLAPERAALRGGRVVRGRILRERWRAYRHKQDTAHYAGARGDGGR